MTPPSFSTLLSTVSIAAVAICASMWIARFGFHGMSQPGLSSADRRFMGCCMMAIIVLVIAAGVALALFQRATSLPPAQQRDASGQQQRDITDRLHKAPDQTFRSAWRTLRPTLPDSALPAGFSSSAS